jgi:hypothetical protein
MKQQPIENQQQREKLKKFLLVLPLLILPFMTMAFWSLGGGKGKQDQQNVNQKGINTELPEAQFKGEKPQDKLSLYDQVARDSASAKNNSPFTSLTAHSKIKDSVLKTQGTLISNRGADANEVKISQKLAQIKQEINKQPEPRPPVTATNANPQPVTNTADVDRLEKLIKSQTSSGGDDLEMKQLEGMVDKILQIQHPEMVTAQLKKQEKTIPDSMYKAFRALIENNQKVYQGSSVKLRLLDTITIKGEVIPKGSFVYGLCQINNQRLLLNIKNIRLGTSILPVDLTVYDLDGMPGVNVPDALTQDAVRNGSDNAVQGLQFFSMDQTMTTQLAGAGVEAAKGLFSKKVKRIKVKLKGGYPVLLRNNQPDKH